MPGIYVFRVALSESLMRVYNSQRFVVRDVALSSIFSSYTSVSLFIPTVKESHRVQHR